jgi:hypothetical protein
VITAINAPLTEADQLVLTSQSHSDASATAEAQGVLITVGGTDQLA